LNKSGHSVTVFEAEDSIGGYLRFGIPDFKLEKKIIDRRLEILAAEGIDFKTGVKIGKDITASDLVNRYDAVMLAIGARKPRDLDIGGRSLSGIHFAMDYLEQQNRRVRGDSIPEEKLISPLNKKVVVIGGGDTGSDCVGNANRQGASSITQIEILPEPPAHRTAGEPWPLWPKLKKTSSSHEEGCERLWCVRTIRFFGDNGEVKGINAVRVTWEKSEDGRMEMRDVPGSGFEISADLVLLSMGFIHPEHNGIIEDLNLGQDRNGNILVNDEYMTSEKGVFLPGIQ
jgi:glutamate synthase (NADPH/NADH) small chain